MAGTLHSGVGAIEGDLPFPLDERRSSSVDHYDKLLGRTWNIGMGAAAMLVQHKSAALASPAALYYEFTDSSAYVVQVTSATGDGACGVSHVNLEGLSSDDYFFLIVPSGEGTFRFSVYDSGSGVSKDDMVQPTAGGKSITDAVATALVTAGIAMEDAAADALMDVMAYPDAFFGNNV